MSNMLTRLWFVVDAIVVQTVSARHDVLQLIGQPQPDVPHGDAMIVDEPPVQLDAPMVMATTPAATATATQAAALTPALHHLQQVEHVWRTVHAFLSGGSQCTFVADPAVISLCHRALMSACPAAIGAGLDAAHLETLHTICTVWLGSCRQWCIAHAKNQERALRVLVQRPSASTLRFSVRALDDWDMCDMDLCAAQHPYPHHGLWKVRAHTRASPVLLGCCVG